MMSFEGFYFVGNIIISIMIIYESIILKKNKGKLYKTPMLTVISVIEFFWLILSCIILYQFTVEPLLLVIPTIFMFQSVFGWIYGFQLLKKEGLFEKLEQDMDTELIIPLKYTDFTLSFGVVFLILSSLGLVYGMILGLA